MKAGDRQDWVLTVDTTTGAANGAVEIAISDNGGGADQVVLSQAFERGFSTRKDRSSSMGLHWSSNTMRALGGELLLESAGSGQGATVRC